ncbi:YjbH domain-containing protein [Melioribacter sp. Ez-97]|uniref:YjbH domain-containing protein n=1 Tax=Melioribacter sp. Ez-97 TaxID=3423434 RepID=UPI003EDB4B7A
MKNAFIRVIVIFFLLPLSYFAYSEATVIKELSRKGFENLSVNVEGTKIFIAYEDRVYRFNADGLFEVMDILKNYREYDTVAITMLNKKIPVLEIRYDNRLFYSVTTGTTDWSDFEKNLFISYTSTEPKEESENQSDFRNDITIHPGFKGQFGDYDNPVRAQINIIPEIRTTWWKGMELNIQTIIPVYNEFKGEGDYIRPGIVSLGQTFKFDEVTYAFATVGYFTENRYGADFSAMKIFNNGDIVLKGSAGYTGYLSVYQNKFYYSDLYLFTYNMSMKYRINKYDLTIGVTAGKFLYEDKSIRVDINRQFGEIELGFFAVRSIDGYTNGGFNFSVPLFPSEYSKPSLVRIRTAENFRWEYRVKGELSSLIGVTYNTGNYFEKEFYKYNPAFIRKELKKKFKSNQERGMYVR